MNAKGIESMLESNRNSYSFMKMRSCRSDDDTHSQENRISYQAIFGREYDAHGTP